MSKHGTALEMSDGQRSELSAAITQQIASVIRGMDGETAQRWIRSKKAIGRAIRAALASENAPRTIQEDWQDFYRKVFDFTVDLSGVVIPSDPGGFARVIIVAQGVTLNRAFQACRDRFPVYCYWDDPEAVITKNDRSPANGSYAIRIRDRVEADDELKKKSAEQLADEGVPGITLLERLIAELKFDDETEKHLDIQNWTLCAGSRAAHGHVPYVYWHGDGLSVYWVGPDSQDDHVRSRAVVS